MRGRVFFLREGPGELAEVMGERIRRALWPSSICWIA